MTIHELVNAMQMVKADPRALVISGGTSSTPITELDVHVSRDGWVRVAINPRTGCFIARRGDFFVAGFANIELLAHEVRKLRG